MKKTWYDSLSEEDKKKKLLVKTKEVTKKKIIEKEKIDNDKSKDPSKDIHESDESVENTADEYIEPTKEDKGDDMDKSTEPSKDDINEEETTKGGKMEDTENYDSKSNIPQKLDDAPTKGDNNEQINIENEAEQTDDEKEMLKCKLCEYSFRKIRADIDKSTLAVHFRIMHPLERKGYGRLIRRIRKLRPTIVRSHKRNRPDHRINFWAKIPASTHASVTSQKPLKRSKRKNEFIRAGALLPDVIRLNNHVTCTRMSQEIYKSQCANLTSVKKCIKEEMCDAHSSLNNLKQISKGLKQILAQSSDASTDWKKF